MYVAQRRKEEELGELLLQAKETSTLTSRATGLVMPELSRRRRRRLGRRKVAN